MRVPDQPPPAEPELLDDLERPGCPACQVAQRSGDGVITRLLTESATDPDTRIRLRSAGGVCPEHARRTAEIAERRVDGQAVAVLAADLLRTVEGGARPRRRLGCHVCEVAGRRVDAYLDLLADAAPSSAVGRAARREDRGLCSAHLLRGLRGRWSPVGRRRLRELHRQVAEPLRAELDAYRRALVDPSQPLDDRLAGAWRRSWEWAHGAAPPR